MAVAEKELGIPHLLDSDDLIVAGEDAIMTLVAEFYHLYHRRDNKHITDENSEPEKIDKKYYSPGPGSASLIKEIEILKQENEDLVTAKARLEILLDEMKSYNASNDSNTRSLKEQVNQQRAKRKRDKTQFQKESDELKMKNLELEKEIKVLQSKTINEAPVELQNKLKELQQEVEFRKKVG